MAERIASQGNIIGGGTPEQFAQFIAAERARWTKIGLDKMIIEIADFKIRGEEQAAFVSALTRAASTVLSQAQGYAGHEILACIETPARVLLRVKWDSVEAHTVGFRQSAAFADWRAIIGPFFAQPPHVEHFTIADGG